MGIDNSKLEPGRKFSGHKYRLDADMVSQNSSAVGTGKAEVFEHADTGSLVPPMAVAALSLRGVVRDLDSPEGTLHAGQELQFSSSVTVNEMLECKATIAQNSVRGGWRFIVVSQEVLGEGDRQIMTGKSTIVLPV